MTSTVPSPTPLRTKALRGAGPELDTRDAIVKAALTLFAKHGVDGVSLRQIVSAAGQANPSAVHYHFQNKDGLISAVLEHVNSQLLPLQAQAVASMDEARRLGTINVREVMRLWATPLVLLYSSSDQGRMAVRFMSRLTWRPQYMGQEQLIGACMAHMDQVCDHLQALLPPDRPRERTFFLTLMATANLMHSLSDASMLSRHPTLGMSQLFLEHPFTLVDWIIDYMAAGLSEQPAKSSLGHNPRNSAA